MTKLKALFFLFAATACTTVPNNVTSEEISLVRNFEANVHQLGLSRPINNESVNQAMVTVLAPFGPSIGVSLIREEIGAEKIRYFYYLEVAIQEVQSNEVLSNGNVHLTTVNLLNYHTKVTDHEFETVFKAMSGAGFYQLNPKSERPPSHPNTIVLDGMYYFIEARKEGQNHLIGRASCEIGVGKDFRTASALFDLSREKFPMIAAQLSKLENAALSDGPC